MSVSPKSIDEIQVLVGEHDSIRIVGSNSHADFRLPVTSANVVLSLASYSGVIDFQAADQVVKVRAGTQLIELQTCLASEGQRLPIVVGNGTVGGAFMMNLPHFYEYEFGNWRDWVLGARFVLADGSDVKAGSNVVKSVAGYDLHRFMVGTRGSLAICTELTLRTFPIRAVGNPDISSRGSESASGAHLWIQRVPLDVFKKAWDALGETRAEGDAKTGTIWAKLEDQIELPRYPGDWVIRSGLGTENVELPDKTHRKLMIRAKGIFDPKDKFNPGEWGFC